MKVRSKTLNLTLLGLFSAIVILLTTVPWLGYINTGTVSITTVHIPVIIGAILLGWKNGAILGAVWGISCLVKAWLAPPSPIEQIIFTNPIISVLPRIVVGAVTALVFALCLKLFAKRETLGKYISTGIAAVIGSFSNSLIVVGLMALLYYPSIKDAFSLEIDALGYFIGSVFALNALLEAFAAALISIPVCKALFVLQKRLGIR